MEGKGRTVRERTDVVVAASSAATRAGVRLALQRPGINVCAEAQTLADLIAVVQREEPDVCIMDGGLSASPVGTAAELKARVPSVAVVLLTEQVDETEFLDAMRVGAAGYLDKGISPEALSNVVRAVAKGEPAVPRSLVVTLINGYRHRPPRPRLDVPADLTGREWEVLDFMGDGLSTGQIADRLLISEVTVRRHISSVLKKLSVPTRTDAINLVRSA
ncbi:MAG TPA: response regulator transcription factor [Gaiellaceae bacterium]